jgi:hypothetical protein
MSMLSRLLCEVKSCCEMLVLAIFVPFCVMDRECSFRTLRHSPCVSMYSICLKGPLFACFVLSKMWTLFVDRFKRHTHGNSRSSRFIFVCVEDICARRWVHRCIFFVLCLCIYMLVCVFASVCVFVCVCVESLFQSQVSLFLHLTIQTRISRGERGAQRAFVTRK